MADWPYCTAQWQRLRRLKLRITPLCEYCPVGTITVAREVDHRKPINDGGEVWDMANLAATCSPCHSRKTRAEQQGKPQPPPRLPKGCDPVTGIPFDTAARWKK